MACHQSIQLQQFLAIRSRSTSTEAEAIKSKTNAQHPLFGTFASSSQRHDTINFTGFSFSKCLPFYKIYYLKYINVFLKRINILLISLCNSE